MMKTDFDFDRAGKQTPYIIPDGFFEDMQDKVSERIRAGRRRRKVKMIVISALTAAVFAGILIIPTGRHQQSSQPAEVMAYSSKNICSTNVEKPEKATAELKKGGNVKSARTETNVNSVKSADNSANEDKWIENISDEDLTLLCSISDDDVFMASSENDIQ